MDRESFVNQFQSPDPNTGPGSKRKHQSGASKRSKRARMEKEKLKTRRITNFFGHPVGSTIEHNIDAESSTSHAARVYGDTASSGVEQGNAEASTVDTMFDAESSISHAAQVHGGNVSDREEQRTDEARIIGNEFDTVSLNSHSIPADGGTYSDCEERGSDEANIIENEFATESLNSHAAQVCGGTVSDREEQSTDDANNITAHSTYDNNEYPTDVGLWQQEMSQIAITYWIKKGPATCRNASGPFEASKKLFGSKFRYCNTTTFEGKDRNGQRYQREWLVYSPSQGKVYCFICKLFCANAGKLSTTGFNDWKNQYILQEHENSLEHKNSLTKMVSRKHADVKGNALTLSTVREMNYWTKVLERVVAVIKTLGSRNLSFRGTSDKIGAPDNGNYLALLELVAQFDPFLENHFKKYGNKGSGSVSYLSSTICNELILLIGQKIHQSILKEVKGYYSISVDSTPDVSHQDQLAVVIRYLHPVTGEPVERYLSFLPIKSHIGRDLAETVLDYLELECKLSIDKIRGQNYDNAYNMSGAYNGMQQAVQEENPYAIFVPCSAHSLNLVGRAAMETCLEIVDFFGIIQEIYNFISKSTHRWALLLEKLEKVHTTIKSLSATRWEQDSKAVTAVKENYDEILETLEEIYNDEFSDGETRCKAKGLITRMTEFEFTFLLVFWEDVLKKFKYWSKSLQEKKMDIKACADVYTAASNYIKGIRDNFKKYEKQAKSINPDIEFKAKRQRIKEPDALASMPASERFRVNVFLVAVDALQENLAKRSNSYNEISNEFSFITEINRTPEYLKERALFLMEKYGSDIDEHFFDELIAFHTYCKAREPSATEFSHQKMFKILVEDNLLNVYKNVSSSLEIFLCMLVSNCTGERAFSKLKLIKSRLRSTLGRELLVALTLMSSETELLASLDLAAIINDFVDAKHRKKMFSSNKVQVS